MRLTVRTTTAMAVLGLVALPAFAAATPSSTISSSSGATASQTNCDKRTMEPDEYRACRMREQGFGQPGGGGDEDEERGIDREAEDRKLVACNRALAQFNTRQAALKTARRKLGRATKRHRSAKLAHRRAEGRDAKARTGRKVRQRGAAVKRARAKVRPAQRRASQNQRAIDNSC